MSSSGRTRSHLQHTSTTCQHQLCHTVDVPKDAGHSNRHSRNYLSSCPTRANNVNTKVILTTNSSLYHEDHSPTSFPHRTNAANDPYYSNDASLNTRNTTDRNMSVSYGANSSSHGENHLPVVHSNLTNATYNPNNSMNHEQMSNSIANKQINGLCGLPNIGNTCYMNSALQCLNNVRELKEIFSRRDAARGNVSRSYVELLEAMSYGHDLRGSINKLQQYISNCSSSFRTYGQADAREFLNVLLNALHDEFKASYGGSTIDDLFTLNIQSQMICQMCRYSENSTESMKFLPLRPNAQGRNRTTLDELLNTFTKPRDINGELQCVGCRRPTQHIEKRIIDSHLPRIIIVHLTRFSAARTKDDTAVEFPLMYNFSDSTQTHQSSYELIGVIIHEGNIYGGHYTAYTKHGQGEWYYFDDARVQHIGRLKPMQLARNAYMLMYAK